jgi:S1-C subfamily serine protease
VRVGHIVVALGRPSGDGIEASMGIVSAIGGPWRSRHGGLVEGYLRTDVSMYPGFSGGPLVDAAGNVVGLNSSSLGPIASVALPVSALTRIAEALRQGGRVRHGYIGVRTQQVPLPADLGRQSGMRSGLLVMGVEPGGPADSAGLMLGDILISFASQPIADADDLQAQLGGDRVGTGVPVVVFRGGERRELTVTVGERN